MHAQIVLFDGFDPLDVIAPYEVLTAGGAAAGGALTVELASADGPREVTSGTLADLSGRIALRAMATLAPNRADLIVVPGALGPMRAGEPNATCDTIPTLLARTAETPLPGLMRQALETPKVTVATVCGGSLALAMAGLIAGRHAVTHHLGMEALAACGVIPVQARVVDDGNLISAGGVTSGLDLGLYLLERFLGPRVAIAVEEAIAYERRGIVWRSEGLEPQALLGARVP